MQQPESEIVESLKDGVSALGLNSWQHGQVCDLIDGAFNAGFRKGRLAMIEEGVQPYAAGV